MTALAALLPAALILLAAPQLFRGRMKSPQAVARGAPASTESAVSTALATSAADLETARREMSEHPDDGAAAVRVASPEMRRADLLALVAGERRSVPAGGRPGAVEGDDSSVRREFMRADPEGTLTAAARAADMALRRKLSPPARLQALLLLANARAALGDHAAEAAALERATQQEPDDARLWLRLAEACGRARRFARAESARAHALALLQGGER